MLRVLGAVLLILSLGAGLSFAQTKDIPVSGHQASDFVVLGRGYDPIEERWVGTCFEPADTTFQGFTGAPTSSVGFKSQVSQEELSEKLGFNADAKARYGVAKFSAGAKFAREASSTSNSLIAVYEASYRFDNQVATTFIPTDVGNALLSDQDRARELCGDYIVSSIGHGAQLFFSIRVDFENSSVAEAFSSVVSFKMPAAEFAAAVESASKKYSASTQVTVSALQIGGDISYLSTIFGDTPEEIGAYTSCTFGSFGDCRAVISSALKYASDESDPSSFVSQIARFSQLEGTSNLPVGLAVIEAGIQLIDEVVAISESSEIVSAAAQAMRGNLLSHFERNFTLNNRAARLLNIPRALTPLQADPVRQILIRSKSNIDILLASYEACYDRDALSPGTSDRSCISVGTEAISKLQDLNDAALVIEPSNIFQYCYFSLADPELPPAALTSIKSAITYSETILSIDIDLSDLGEACTRTDEALNSVSVISPPESLRFPDLTIFRMIPELEKLDLRNNHVEDVSGLVGASIKTLDLRRNSVSDVAPLAEVKNLVRLYIANNDPSASCDIFVDIVCVDGNYGGRFLAVAGPARSLPMTNACSAKTASGEAFVASRIVYNTKERTGHFHALALEHYSSDGSLVNATTSLREGALQPAKFFSATNYGNPEGFRCTIASLDDKTIVVSIGTRIYIHDSEDNTTIRVENIAGRTFSEYNAGAVQVHSLGDGRVFVLGLRSFVWNVESDTITVLPVSSIPRFGSEVVPIGDGRFLSIGGYIPNRGPSSAVELYDIANASIDLLSPLSVARFGHSAAWIAASREVLVTGGITGGPWYGDFSVVDHVELIGVDSLRVEPAGWALPRPRAFHNSFSVSDSEVLIVGGFQGGGTRWGLGRSVSSAYIYNSFDDMFFEVPDYEGSTRALSAVSALEDGRWLMRGGLTEPLSSINVITPSASKISYAVDFLAED